MRRFGRKLDVERSRAELPITPVFFDALYLDGSPLVDEPLSRRIDVVNDQSLVVNRAPRIVTADRGEAAAFAARAIAAGHEGLGITTATATAELIAALAVGRHPAIDPSSFAPARDLQIAS